MVDNPMPLGWAKREKAKEVVVAPRHPCYAFNGNSVVEAVCVRVSTQPAGNREYCVAHDCQSPWRITLGAKRVVLPSALPEPAQPEPPPTPLVVEVVEEKVLRGMDSRGRKNLAALEEASAELRATQTQLRLCDLIRAASRKLGKSTSGLRTFFYRALPEETRVRLLYGNGRKLTRDEIKFSILMRVRREMRQRGEPAPTKRKLAALAAKPLGMTINSAEGYVYDLLTPEQAEALEFVKPPFTLEQQIATLKRIRQEMREAGRPKPR